MNCNEKYVDCVDIDKSVEEYKREIEKYKKFEKILKEYLKEIIDALSEKENPIEMGENDIEIKTRTKDPESFRGKIKRKTYSNPIYDVTDLVGAKIMLTSLRYAELVYELVKEKFASAVIEEIDKSKILKDERKFGYLGKHIVIRCNQEMQEERFREFSGMSAEIQIKTLLQHTWAEIEHKLRYKPQSKLDEEKQRYFDRLAAMIEVADDLFKELILEWENISNKKNQRIPEEIEQIEKNGGVEIDNEISLLDSEAILLYLSNEKVQQKFSHLKNQVHNLLILEEVPDLVSSEFIALLELAGIYGVRGLNQLLEDHTSVETLQEYIREVGHQIRFHQVLILQILVYARLDRKTKEIAKNNNFVYRNVYETIDAIQDLRSSNGNV